MEELSDYAFVIELFIDDKGSDVMPSVIHRNVMSIINEDWLRELIGNRLDKLLSSDVREQVSFEVY